MRDRRSTLVMADQIPWQAQDSLHPCVCVCACVYVAGAVFSSCIQGLHVCKEFVLRDRRSTLEMARRVCVCAAGALLAVQRDRMRAAGGPVFG